jgi:hypothetical protein
LILWATNAAASLPSMVTVVLGMVMVCHVQFGDQGHL